MPESDRSLREAIAYSLMPRVGGVAFRKGVERHGSASAAFRAGGDAPDRDEALRAAEAMLTQCRGAGAQVLVFRDGAYPESLLDLPDPPGVLFALGDVALAGRRRVGIVGTRHSSASGDRIAQQMAAALVSAGVVVVSGMAFGIDAAAHRGALEAGGGTIAVLGGGVDLPYPPSHAALHRRIADDGLVISEKPMGSRPTLGAFPRRNRIIAALSETLIVIEAGERSGALITARIALDLGRNVASVPGPIDSPRHVGSNRLLSEGASFIASVDDVLSIAGIDSAKAAPEQPVAQDTGSRTEDPAQTAILNAVRAGASDLEGLTRSTRLSPREVATALSTLELLGELQVTPTGGLAIVD